MNGVPSDQSKAWVRLKTGKEFSRLLYPNPVCFLSTTEKRSLPAPSDHGVPITSTCEGPCSTSTAHDNMTISGNSHYNTSSINSDNDNQDHTNRNVMILSWLTPTNNQGRFMFSINKARYSASLLAPSNAIPNDNGDTTSQRCTKRMYSQTTDNDCNTTFKNYQIGIEFALSVPVQGMEDMVLDVGSISGRFSSKFPSPTRNAIDDDAAQTMTNQLSNRQRKRLKKKHLTNYGVSGLSPVSLGAQTSVLSSEQLFAIQGTVAHLKCRTYAIIGTPSCDISNKINDNAKSETKCNNDTKSQTASTMIDEEHLLVMAEVLDAHVHPSYWDSQKSLFCPQSKVPPYLTFFGSQTFGYVRSEGKHICNAS